MSRQRLRVLVTAGPTREHVDPVRYLSNESSGRMGFAIAEQAARAGHQVILIAGPVHLETPKGVERVDVVSARDMLAALREHFPNSDLLFMAAAVADYRPRTRRRGKWKVKEGKARELDLSLVRNPDLLATIARRKGPRRVVAFALETSRGLERARAKLVAKNADWIVLNDATALNAAKTSVTVLSQEGEVAKWSRISKSSVASKLVNLVVDSC